MTERPSTESGRNSTRNSSRPKLGTTNLIVCYFVFAHFNLDPFKQSQLIRDFNELYQKIYDKEKYINL